MSAYATASARRTRQAGRLGVYEPQHGGRARALREAKGRASRSRINVALSTPQWQVFSSEKRLRVLVTGRRVGKTTLLCVEALTAAAAEPNGLCWYVGPTYRQAKDVAWEMLKTLCPPAWIRGRPNESTLSIRLVNGSLIQLKGAEKPDRLRGRDLSAVVVDEFQIIDRVRKKLWGEVLQPSLATRRGRAIFGGTPAGYNEAYDMFEEARLDMAGLPGTDGKPATGDWGAWQFTTAQGGWVSPEEIAASMRLQDPRTFRQEYLASFETLAGRVYDSFIAAQDIDDTILDDGRTLFVGMDFNIMPMTAVLGIRVRNAATKRRELHILDAWEMPNSNTIEVGKRIREWVKASSNPGRRVVICPDASGKARHTSSAAGETDFTILGRFGFEISAPDANPPVKDRINAVNTALCSATGHRRVKIRSRATPLTKALNGLTWKDGRPDKKSPHIHMTDAFGYLVWSEFNLLEHVAAWSTTPFRLV